jgi:5'-nucleotidase
MNASGYDAAALGNHEFDWGQDTLAARIAESRFPWLAANLYLSSTRRQPEWARPWVLLKRGGVRTAVIGITLPETPAGLPADRLAGLEFGPAIPAIREAAAQARAAGADFVVVLLHVGATCRVPGRVAEEASMDCTGPLLQVADSVHAFVDLVMGGHTHQRVLTTEGGIPVVEAASYGTAYSVTDLEKHGDSVHVRYQGVRTPFADEVRPDSAVEVAIAAWRTRVAPLTERVVATLASNMQDATGGMSAEFPLGILVAEAQRAMAETDVGLVNSSAIRRSLPAGPVTYGMLFELQPFQNQLVRVELSGRELRAVLERALTSEGTPDAQLAGMTVTYVAAAPQGRRIVGIRLADGRPLGDTDRVTLASTDFMVTSPRYPELQRARVIPTAMKDVDALERYLAKLPSPIQPPPTGRWRTVP